MALVGSRFHDLSVAPCSLAIAEQAIGAGSKIPARGTVSMATAPIFYLGTHIDGWLNHVGVPLFVSHRRLARRKALPKARMGWALDSGGFSELSLYGGWRTTPEDYVAAVKHYDRQIGNLEWASPMDWMFTYLADSCRNTARRFSEHITSKRPESTLEPQQQTSNATV